MKRFLFFAVAAVLFAACSKDAISEEQGIQNIVDEAPATLTVGFEDDETRIQLNEAQKTVWTKGDLVSVFYLSDANQQWQYTGETGARTAKLTRVNAGNATTTTTGVVVVYPYNENYYLNTRTLNVKATLPATQTYLKDSYGLDGNIMISQSEYNNISLKNVCGWLKLQLTGNGEQIKSITVRGNNGEQVAGELYINSADATATLASEAGDAGEDDGENATGDAGGNLVFEDTVLTEVTLNCLDSSSPTEKGVALGAEATAFYIALPPQTFAKGLTVEITAVDGSAMTKTTDNEVVIERNHIKPMASLTFKATKPANNEIWYTATAKVEPFYTDEFGATYRSNVWDSETGKGVITFEGDVTKIGYYAFYQCRSLTSVTIPDSVTTIGESAFAGCDSLKEFKGKFAADGGRCLIMDGVLNAFAIGCGATQYTIPDSVTTIGDSAFYYCESLTSVTIPDSVTTIGESAFACCDSLTSVTIPDSVTTIGGGAFSFCYSLKEFKGKFAADGGRCLIKDNTIIAYAEASGTTYTIPDSVTTIGDYAFSWCNSLTSVTIGDSVTTIGEGAFNNCKSLTSVTIPNSVTTIGDWAFSWCDSLKTVYCKPTTPPTGGSGMFSYNASDRKIYVPASDDDSIINAYKAAAGWSSYKASIFEEGLANNEIWYTNGSTTEPTAPNKPAAFGDATIQSNTYEAEKECWVITFDKDITEIGYLAFYSCDSLTSVTIPDSVTTIGYGAFHSCDSLTSVTIPDSVTTIGERAFQWCSSLTSVTIPDSVTTIGEGAFICCESLTSVTIPDSVTTIGKYAFAGCKSLKEFKGKFAADNGRCLIMDNTIIAYANASGTTYTIPDSVTTIGDSAFYECSSLTSVTIPDSVTTIGEYAFYYCDSLTSVTIPDSVTTIGEQAFYSCESLTSVTIGDSVTTIGYMAFASCGLTSVTIPDSVTTIGERAFNVCDSLKEFKGKFAADGGRCLIMDNTIIAYANASGTTYTIPDSVTTIGEWAFEGCYSLTSVIIPDSVTTIGYRAFSTCTSLTSVTIPNSVTTIGEYAFFSCHSLTSVTIGNSVTTIGNEAFYCCYSLKTVYCKPTTPPTGGVAMFSSNAAGRRIFVPASDNDSIIKAYKAKEYWSEYADYIFEEE